MLMGNGHCQKHGIYCCEECISNAQSEILASNSQIKYGNINIPEEEFLDENIDYHMRLDKYKKLRLMLNDEWYWDIPPTVVGGKVVGPGKMKSIQQIKEFIKEIVGK